MSLPVVLRLALCGAALGLASSAAFAINDMWEKNAPVSRMTAKDFEIAEAVIYKALDAGKDGEVFEWKNPATSASGNITTLGRFEKNGMQCRVAAFTITAGGLTNRSKWALCKTSGRWKFLEGR
jgi:surface antigen